MGYEHLYYPESRFGGFTDLDGTVRFYFRVNVLAGPGSVVVDFGCGRGQQAEERIPFKRNLVCLRGRVARVIGLDVDPGAAGNPLVDEFHLLEGDRWPLLDDSADLVVCDQVMEHLPHPDAFFSEARRVLRDGGHLCIRTANAWSYVVAASKLIPGRHHAAVLGKVQDGRKAEDVFPTLYRCNTIPRMRRALDHAGFEHAVYGYEAEPRYLSFSRFAYWLGTLHQRLAPSWLGPALFAFARVRKGAGAGEERRDR